MDVFSGYLFRGLLVLQPTPTPAKRHMKSCRIGHVVRKLQMHVGCQN